MPKSIYITSLEPGSGKAVVALGFMEQLSLRFEKVGIFRPVIEGGSAADRIIELMAAQYRIPLPTGDLSGVTMAEATPLLAAGKYDDLYGRILERYKALEAKCDMVLCVGTDYTGVSTALEFDFNVEVARNLGSALVPVINGQGKDAEA